MNNYRVKENQSPTFAFNNFVPEDIEISLNSFKKKKTGISDPRFKKIIDIELQNLVDSETGKSDTKVQMASTRKQEKRNLSSPEKLLSFLSFSKDSSLLSTPNLKFSMEQKEQDLSAEVTKDTGFQLSDKSLLSENAKEFSCNNIRNKELLDEVEKAKNGYAIDLKRSVSDCIMQTPLKENESDDNIRIYSSSSKLLNSENWVKPQKVFPEKRRSVVTVIGQTQMKSFNQILNEIQQRRKLAKEMDKHALCEALMSSIESHSKFKNLVAKVDLALPDGKVIYSTEKVYTRKNNTLQDSMYLKKSVEYLDSGDKRRKCDMIPGKNLSTGQLGKKKFKRVTKKSISLDEKNKIKGTVGNVLEVVSPGVLWLMLTVLCLALGFSFIFYLFETPQTYYILQIFRPKTTTWYEKLLLL